MTPRVYKDKTSVFLLGFDLKLHLSDQAVLKGVVQASSHGASSNVKLFPERIINRALPRGVLMHTIMAYLSCKNANLLDGTSRGQKFSHGREIVASFIKGYLGQIILSAMEYLALTACLPTAVLDLAHWLSQCLDDTVSVEAFRISLRNRLTTASSCCKDGFRANPPRQCRANRWAPRYLLCPVHCHVASRCAELVLRLRIWSPVLMNKIKLHDPSTEGIISTLVRTYLVLTPISTSL